MPRFPYQCLLTAILAPVFCLQSAAQTIDLNDKRFEIPRVENAPAVDGIFSPDEWDQAIIIDDIHETTPAEFTPPGGTD